MPVVRGALPALAMPTTRARGARPYRVAAASPASSTSLAASSTPLALLAVNVPSGQTTPVSFASIGAPRDGRP